MEYLEGQPRHVGLGVDGMLGRNPDQEFYDTLDDDGNAWRDLVIEGNDANRQHAKELVRLAEALDDACIKYDVA